MNQPCLKVENLSKSFTLHNQGSVSFKVLENISFEVHPGECIVLQGESGQGKSTLLRCLYANYLTDTGTIIFNDVDSGQIQNLSDISEREKISLRKRKIAYVSQFLQVIPRVATLEVVMQPLLDTGVNRDEAENRATDLLKRLRIPERLWTLSPTTFSGGEQQRINIAREFSLVRPLMLLDEPTASLDANNREMVLDLIDEAKNKKSAIIAIFHDQQSRDRVADKVFNLSNGCMQ